MRRQSFNRLGRSASTWLIGVALLLTLAPAAGQAAALKVTCGATLTASVKLERDLLNCPQDGLVVGANGITVDLNGHAIEGPGTDDFRWDGVDNGAGFDNVIVTSGLIRNFGGDGVYLDQGASANRLHNLVLKDNGIGLEVIASSDNLITASTLSANHHFGMIFGESTNTHARGNGIHLSGHDGILVRGSIGSLITTNTFTRNINSAIQMLGGSSNTIRQNVFSGSPSLCCGGIFVSSDGNVIANNEFSRFPSTLASCRWRSTWTTRQRSPANAHS